MSDREICGAPMVDGKTGEPTVCGRPKGHKGHKDGHPGHRSLAAMECSRKRAREQSAQRCAGDSICTGRGCSNIVPKGAVACPECLRQYARKSYAKNAETRREYSREYSRDYVKTPRGRQNSRDVPHVEHVIAVSQFREYVMRRFHENVLPRDAVIVSATRLACAACNLSKHDRAPASYVLDCFRAGLPVVQAPTVA